MWAEPSKFEITYRNVGSPTLNSRLYISYPTRTIFLWLLKNSWPQSISKSTVVDTHKCCMNAHVKYLYYSSLSFMVTFQIIIIIQVFSTYGQQHHPSFIINRLNNFIQGSSIKRWRISFNFHNNSINNTILIFLNNRTNNIIQVPHQ